MLLDAGIDYIYMGQELGGYRKGGYQAFTNNPDFKAGVKKLEEIAQIRKVAIVCAERFPWRCHRRFIAMALLDKGWQINHIIDRGRYWLSKELLKPRQSDQ